MIKYHINPETGNVNKCEAKISCEFGGVQDHFKDKEAAQQAAEGHMSQKYREISTFSKKDFQKPGDTIKAINRKIAVTLGGENITINEAKEDIAFKRLANTPNKNNI